MAKIDYLKAIKSLELSYDILPKKPEALSKSDLKILGEACSLYLKFYEPFVGASIDPRIIDAYSFHKFVIGTEIENLINKFKEAEEAEKETKQKTKEQDASIPPELEALVAEYRQNQALLESEDVKNNSQKSVALQVKMAIAHSKIRALALANRGRRLAKGEKIASLDSVLVSLGSPKSESKTAALAASFKAVQEVAFTNENFIKLSPETQNIIITQAVELNTACVTNIHVAIESAALLISTSDLPPDDQKNVSKVSSGYIQSVYNAVNTQTQQAATYDTQIIENKIVLLKLEKESRPLKDKDLEIINIQIKSLVETNEHLSKKLDSLPHQFDIFVNNQLPDYQKFEGDIKTRFEKALEKDLTLIDLPDRIKLANKKISELHNNLERNGVKPHIYTPMDDAKLLEDAIRHDMPGVLRSYSGYEAEYAAALVNHPKTQDPDLSPLAILLFGKELTPVVFTKILQFASTKENAGTALGKLFQTRKDIFEVTGTQIRKISESLLGKEISKPSIGIAKVFKPISSFFGKISDKLGKAGTVFRAISNPWGALRSWAGRKAGEQFIRLLKNNVPQAVLKKIPDVLLQGGITGVKTFAKEALVKLAVKGITWAAVKLGISVTAESLNAFMPGLGVIVDIGLQVIIWVFEKTLGYAKKVFDNISTSLYGEKVSARDLIAIPVAGVATVTATAVGGVITFFGALGTATVAAAGSAVAITVAGIFIGIFFYITSIAVAPLLSTLVNLQSTATHTTTGSAFCSQEVADRAKTIADNLQRGFNGYYNKSPDYPEIWNPIKFAQNPNPVNQQSVLFVDDMFWCNYLVTKSYEENGKQIRFSFSGMIPDFQTKGTYLNTDEITISDICPGMAVFFDVGDNKLAHVGVVYSVSTDGFTSVESNSTERSFFYPVDSSGNFQAVGTIKVASFGSL